MISNPQSPANIQSQSDADAHPQPRAMPREPQSKKTKETTRKKTEPRKRHCYCRWWLPLPLPPLAAVSVAGETQWPNTEETGRASVVRLSGCVPSPLIAVKRQLTD